MAGPNRATTADPPVAAPNPSMSAGAIVVRREAGRWHVTVEPDPGDGSHCADDFPDREAAMLFASRIRRARGWPITETADQRQAWQARRG